MADVIKETVTTTGNSTTPVVVPPTVVKASKTQTIDNLVAFFFGVLEILLGFRLIFKLLGASTASAFVRITYGITGLFTLPFEGIFRRAVAPGIETAAVLEPATVVALIVYALVGWGIVQLVHISAGEQPISSEA